MNILYISPIVPYPLIDGDRQRAFHLLKVLAANHTVHLLCFIRSRADQAALQELNSFCASVHGVPISRTEIVINACLGWFSKKPLNVLAFKKKAMHRKISLLIKEHTINAVHAYRLRMAQYVLATKGVYRILDYTDSMYRYFQNRKQQDKSWLKQIYISHDLKRLKTYESGISNYLDTCLVSSPHDQDIILKNGSAPWIEVVSNGVDIQRYQGGHKLTQESRIVFVGNMHYVPNAKGLQWFCQHCWPMIKAQEPKASLFIIGQSPTGTVNQEHRLYPGATFRGIVTDLQQELKQARVGICPIQIASGRQFKVIEYFSAQLPVVTTSLVAKNLDANHEEHLLVADQAELFSQHIIGLMQNDQLAINLGQHARQLAEEKYDWSIVGKQLISHYAKLEAAAQVKDSSKPGTAAEKIKTRQMLRFRKR